MTFVLLAEIFFFFFVICHIIQHCFFLLILFLYSKSVSILDLVIKKKNGGCTGQITGGNLNNQVIIIVESGKVCSLVS